MRRRWWQQVKVIRDMMRAVKAAIRYHNAAKKMVVVVKQMAVFSGSPLSWAGSKIQSFQVGFHSLSLFFWIGF